MTQDQCLDNGHQAISNNRSTNDQVSDDLNNSKNTALSNGVKSVQEFNVGVNSKRREHSVEVAAIVQNRSVDADIPLAVRILTKNQNPADTSCEFVNPIENSLNIIDVNKSANNILPDMTVITHQNSSENIRDIIANSDQGNKVTSDSQITCVGNNAESGQNKVNRNIVNKSSAISKKVNLSRHNAIDESDKVQDPVERLNKLRASISNALSEVKGVLKQYSTEQNVDSENESTPSSKPKDDGPVRFRFVRKIRRRSVFSEDDNGGIRQNSKSSEQVKADTKTESENNVLQIAGNHLPKISANSKCDSEQPTLTVPENELVANTSKEECSTLSNIKVEKRDTETLNNATKQILQSKEEEKANQKLREDNSSQKEATNAPIKRNDAVSDSIQSCVLQQNNEHIKSTTDIVDKKVKRTPPNIDPIEIENPSSTAVIKAKNTKSKKIVKKDRRASIAAVEINQVLTDKSTSQLELKTQRRPSDSGTLVKQAARVKVKNEAKAKLFSHLEIKTSPKLSDNTEVPIVAGINVECSKVNLPPKDDTKTPTLTQLQQLEAKIQPQLSDSAAIANTEVKSEVKVASFNKIEVSKVIDVNAKPNQVDQLPKNDEKTVTTPQLPQLELKTQLQPSNSTILVKQTADLKSNIEVKSKLASQHQVKTTPSEKTEVCKVVSVNAKPNQVNLLAKDDEKTATSAQLEQLKLNTQRQSSDLTTVVKQAAEAEVKSELCSQHQVKTAPVNKTEVPVVVGVNTQPSQKVDNKTASTQSKSIKITNTSATELLLKSDTASMTQTLNVANNHSNQSVKTEVLTTKNNGQLVDKVKLTDPPTVKHIKDAISAKDQFVQTPEIAVENIQIKADQANKEPEVPNLSNVPEDEKTTDAENMCLEDKIETETTPQVVAVSPKKKRKAKRKVVIRRIKRKLSKDDTFIQTQEAPSELEICEKEIEEKDPGEEESDVEAETVPKQRKPCLKARQFEIGDVVMYAERYKKTQVKWRKGIVIERITSISYKLDLEGEEKPAHISYIKKFTDRKVNFGGKEYLEIDYAQIEEDEEKERNYSIWNLV